MVADVVAAEQFGPYLIYERLGVGGMATVHRALERGIEGFERVVALKRLLPHLAEDASFIKSFVREAKLASLLNHVNIVQLYELGRVGTEYFISMEYIDGRDIRRILRHARKVTGPPPIHVTVGLVLQLCEALDYAHAKTDEHGAPLGLVHRDVSPSNLLITQAGHLKVIDFGIAKAQSSQLRTQTGRVKGKLAYMAPEAIAGKDLDARSDLFAVGVIAHELLTARPLFASKNEYQTLLKVQRGEITPPSTFNQACPPELDAIVSRALARDPGSRYPTAGQLRDELHELRRHYNLQTGHRDVAQWVDWAFSVEPPSGGFASTNTFERTGSPLPDVALGKHPRLPTAVRARRDDDDAVEIAWGGGEPEQPMPIVLDEVPDVSSKHLGSSSVHFEELELADEPPHVNSDYSRMSYRDPLDTGPAERTSDVFPPRSSRAASSMSGLGGPDPDAETIAIADPYAGGTISNLSLPPSARVRASSVSARDLPSLEPAPFEDDFGGPSPARRTATPAPAPVASTFGASIGASIAARQSPQKKWLIGAAVVGAAAIGAVLLLARGSDRAAEVPDTKPEPARVVGKVKFETVPTDAEISVEGQPLHRGSPWSIELAAGIYQVTIQRTGYKSWLTSLELGANQTQILRAVLEPLGRGSANADEATLILASPTGLEVVLDGKLLAQRTPIKMPIKAGPHTISVRQGGVEVWRHAMTAQANSDYEFTPIVERRERVAAAPKVPETKMVIEDRTERARPSDKAGDKGEKTIDKPEMPALPSIDSIAPPVVPAPPAPTAADPAPAPAPAQPQQPAILQQPPKPAPAVPAVAGPVLIAPNAVSRTGGQTPSVGKSRLGEVPPLVSARLCIDTGGRVTRVDVITKLERLTTNDLTNALKSWTYTPYKQKGTAMPACFVVNFRVK